MAEPKKTPAPVGHNPVSYPKEIPMHCIGHIIGHLRGTETLALPDLGQHITTTVGCGLEFMKTTPQPVGAKSSENFSAMSDDEVADKLETLTAPQAKGVGDAPEAFPTWLLPILFDVFRRYFGF